MKYTFTCLIWLIATTWLLALNPKPRTIITTDGEIDDVDSYIRMLLYSNEFEIDGLVYSSSMWHYKGDEKGTTMVSEMEMTREMYGERANLRWPGTSWMHELLDAYEKVYPRLSTHAVGYPSADYLRSVVRVGNIDFEGEMSKDTDGSNFIKAALLDVEDPRPIYLQAWGGANTIARALKSIEEEFSASTNWPVLRKRIAQKAIVYTITEQDATISNYIRTRWPEVIVMLNGAQFWVLAYGWKTAVPTQLHSYLQGEFMGEHIINNHGPLMKMYYSYGDGQHQEGDPENIHGDPTKIENAQWGSFGVYDFISEGDTPAFLHLVDVGLNNFEYPDYGGWSGRMLPQGTNDWEDGSQTAEWNPYTKQLDTRYAQTRWLEAMQNDFAARADWCVLPFAEANHPPQVSLEDPNVRHVKPGEVVQLVAKTSDPDGDNLNLYWWRYSTVDSYQTEGEEGLNNTAKTFTVPSDLKQGQTIHLILSVKDTGTPSLTRYARIVLIGR